MTTDATSIEDLTVLVWGLRVFLVFVSLLLASLLVWGWWLVARAFSEFWRGWRAHDLWLPFLRDEHGQWGPLTSNRRWAIGRANERGSASALAWRWGFWLVQASALTWGVAYGLWAIVRMLALVWV